MNDILNREEERRNAELRLIAAKAPSYTVPPKEVAAELHTSIDKLKGMILNGTLPIGAVAEPNNPREHHVIVIWRNRWEKWKAGELRY